MSARCLIALLAAAALAPALARADEPADDGGFARIEARLCSQFEVCEPPCGSAGGDAVASGDAR